MSQPRKFALCQQLFSKTRNQIDCSECSNGVQTRGKQSAVISKRQSPHATTHHSAMNGWARLLVDYNTANCRSDFLSRAALTAARATRGQLAVHCRRASTKAMAPHAAVGGVGALVRVLQTRRERRPQPPSTERRARRQQWRQCCRQRHYGCVLLMNSN